MSQQDPDLRDDPLNRVFPKVAKCNFNKYGPSGTVEIFDGLCILSLNIINEKASIESWASLIWFFKTSSSDLCSPVVLVCDSVHTVCHPAGVEGAVHYIKGLQGVHAQKTDKQHGHSKNNQTLHWLSNNCTTSSGWACCHLLCQADHGGLVCPHADWGQYWCSYLHWLGQTNWNGSKESLSKSRWSNYDSIVVFFSLYVLKYMFVDTTES